MAWWNRKPRPSQDALTAAAIAVKASRNNLVGTGTAGAENWQKFAWDFYDSLGEFRYAVDWKSEMISRVRLRAAKKVPGSDEPLIEDKGPAADLVSDFCDGVGGQAEMMSTLSTQLSVVGEGWLIGEQGEKNTDKWRVYSSDEVQIRSGKYQVIDDEKALSGKGNQWRDVDPENLPIRVWNPHKRYHYMADSSTRAAMSTMRELELVNRKLQATYLSRLASAGIVIFPDEITFPVRPEFKDEPDPFIREWIETAATAIKNPGTASATVPIPMRVPGEYVDKVKFIDFSTAEDEKIIEKRESAIRRLATQLDMPAEVLLGMGDVNHWTAWQLEEGAIKAHISSDVEMIVTALTNGYLIPMLKAGGMSDEEAQQWVVWYDASELTMRPDKSDDAIAVYDRLELSGEALRRETGFDPEDAPNDEEIEQIVLKVIAKAGAQTGFLALSELIGKAKLKELGQPAQPPPPSDGVEEEEGDGESNRDIPDTQNDPPDNERELSNIQAKAEHRFHKHIDGWSLYHPDECKDHLMTCPVAESSRHLKSHPGKSGTYRAWLSAHGEFIIGEAVFDLSSYLKGHTRKAKRNGSSNRSTARKN